MYNEEAKYTVKDLSLAVKLSSAIERNTMVIDADIQYCDITRKQRDRYVRSNIPNIVRDYMNLLDTSLFGLNISENEFAFVKSFIEKYESDILRLDIPELREPYEILSSKLDVLEKGLGELKQAIIVDISTYKDYLSPDNLKKYYGMLGIDE